MTTQFTLSIFGDDINTDPRKHVTLMRDMRIGYAEARRTWRYNVLEIDDAGVEKVKNIYAADGIKISSITSLIGNRPITDELQPDLDQLRRAVEVCGMLQINKVKIRGYQPPEDADPDDHIDEVIERLGTITQKAAEEGIILLLENNPGTMADTIERCHQTLSTVDSPHLRLAWNPAHFVLAGVEQPTTNGWEKLGPYVSYVHIKDADADGTLRVAGEGAGEVPDLLVKLSETDFDGLLALQVEPFMKEGFGEEPLKDENGASQAILGVRRLMLKNDLQEVSALGQIG